MAQVFYLNNATPTFLAFHYRESAYLRQKEEALMLQIHCCNGKVNMINLNTKRKHGETAKHYGFKDGQFKVIP